MQEDEEDDTEINSLAAAYGLELPGGKQKQRRVRDYSGDPEKSIKATVEALNKKEVREKEKRDAALGMKRWVRVLLENVDNGNLILKQALPDGEGKVRGKEEILREYAELDVYNEATPVEEIVKRINELREVVGIERYFANVERLAPSTDGMPTCGEEMLHSLAAKWGRGKYVTGGPVELVSRDGVVNERNVLDLFVDRATLVTANNPRGKVNYSRLIYFGNQLRTEEMDDALNNPEYLARRSYEIISNEAERGADGQYLVADGKETIETREIRVEDPRFDKLMGYSYWNFLYYFVVVHNRERAQWRVSKGSKDGAMAALKQMFNVEGGNDLAARNGYDMLWVLPNPENEKEVAEWIDGVGRGSFGLLGQRLTNAMDSLLEAHPPEDTAKLDVPVVIEKLPNGKTMFEEALGEEGVKKYYEVLAEGLLSKSEAYKQAYTHSTIEAIQTLKLEFLDERSQKILNSRIKELQAKTGDNYLAIQLNGNDFLKETIRRIVATRVPRAQIDAEVQRRVEEIIPYIKGDFAVQIRENLRDEAGREAQRVRERNTDPNPALRKYRADREELYDAVGEVMRLMTGTNYTARGMEYFARAAALSANVPWEELNPSYDKNLPGPTLKELSDKALVEAANATVNLPNNVKEYAGRFYLNMRGWMLLETKNHTRAIFPFMTSVMHAEQDVTERKANGGRKGGGLPTVRKWFKHMTAPLPYSIGVVRVVDGKNDTWSIAETLRGSREMKIDYTNPPTKFTTPIEAESDWYQMLEGQVNTKEFVGKGIQMEKLIDEEGLVINEEGWDDTVNGTIRGQTRTGYHTHVQSWKYYDQKIRAADPKEEGLDKDGNPVRVIHIRTQKLIDWELDPVVTDLMAELGVRTKDEGIAMAAIMGELAYLVSREYRGKKIPLEDFDGRLKTIYTTPVRKSKPLMTLERYDKMLKLIGIKKEDGLLNQALYQRNSKREASWLEQRFEGILGR